MEESAKHDRLASLAQLLSSQKQNLYKIRASEGSRANP